MRVLTWNLMHGRSVPPAGRDLLDDFAAALAGWDWDAALLQEVPPWWPEALGRRLVAEHRLVLTSRNALPPLRRAIAVRWPDLIKSNGGGCNAILARRGHIVEHRKLRLRLAPERRWLHAVRLAGAQPTWLANLHCSADSRIASSESRRAAETVLTWAAGSAAVLGGDFNVREPALEGFVRAGGRDVDHLFIRGFRATGPAAVLDRATLSDHPPLAVELDEE